MEPISIAPTTDTPGVFLNKQTGEFSIFARSLPEDAAAFYAPIMQWLTQYAKTPNEITDFHFNLEYFNTASSKQLFKILSFLDELSKKKKTQVIINWHYQKEDKDTLSIGRRFSKLITTKINFIES